MRCLIFVILLSSLNVFAENAGSFSTAKKWAESIYSDHRTSFYCGCIYSAGKVVDKASCGYSPRKPFTRSGKVNKRANRIEWEHVLPASLMGQQLACWGSARGQYEQCVKSNGKLKSGRDCCLKVNDAFRHAHNDLVGLVPAIGELNADRSNYRYGIIEGESRKYGACDFEVENRIAEPPKKVRGDIARIQLYLLGAYGPDLGFLFDEPRFQMLRKWDVEDPVTDWERQRNKRIRAKQGGGNPLVDE